MVRAHCRELHALGRACLSMMEVKEGWCRWGGGGLVSRCAKGFLARSQSVATVHTQNKFAASSSSSSSGKPQAMALKLTVTVKARVATLCS